MKRYKRVEQTQMVFVSKFSCKLIFLKTNLLYNGRNIFKKHFTFHHHYILLFPIMALPIILAGPVERCCPTRSKTIARPCGPSEVLFCPIFSPSEPWVCHWSYATQPATQSGIDWPMSLWPAYKVYSSPGLKSVPSIQKHLKSHQDK